jgi:hypothetical protein
MTPVLMELLRAFVRVASASREDALGNCLIPSQEDPAQRNAGHARHQVFPSRTWNRSNPRATEPQNRRQTRPSRFGRLAGDDIHQLVEHLQGQTPDAPPSIKIAGHAQLDLAALPDHLVAVIRIEEKLQRHPDHFRTSWLGWKFTARCEVEYVGRDHQTHCESADSPH